MVATIFIAFASLIMLLMLYNFVLKRRKLPPGFKVLGPTPLPIIGNKLSLIGAEQTFDSLIKWSKEYGPVYTYWIGEVPIVAITDYQLMRETFIRDGDAYAGRDFFKDAYTICKSTGGIHGVVPTEGEQWRQLRRFSLQLLRNLGMGRNRMQETILIEVESLLNTIDKNLEENVEAHDLISPVDLAIGSVLNQIVFGYRFAGDSEKEFYMLKAILDEHMKAFDSIVTQTVLMIPWLRHFPLFSQAFKNFERRLAKIYVFLDRQIQATMERKEKAKVDDIKDSDPTYFIDEFLSEIERSRDVPEKQEFFNLASLRGLCWDLYSAGQETTSNTLRFLILYMMLYPEIQQKMQDELDSIELDKDDGLIKYESRTKLPYTIAVINETQRYCNLIAQNLNHRTMREVEVLGYKIVKHTVIVPQISCVLYDEKIFPNARQFLPDRFLTPDGQLKKCEEFIPFSVGKRLCLGEAMAKMELFLFTANLFRKFRISVVDEHNPPSSKPQAGLTMSTVPFKCRVERRC